VFWHQLLLQGADVGHCCWLSCEIVRLFLKPALQMNGKAQDVSASVLNEKKGLILVRCKRKKERGMAETDPSSIPPTSSSQLSPLFLLISLQMGEKLLLLISLLGLIQALTFPLPTAPLLFCFSPSFGPLHPPPILILSHSHPLYGTAPSLPASLQKTFPKVCQFLELLRRGN